MTGTSTCRTMSGTARAASSVLTVTRTSSEPAWWRARTCAAVAAASAVSVLVMDWTTMGWAEPTGTPPTSTVTVRRRRMSGIGGKCNRRPGGVLRTGLRREVQDDQDPVAGIQSVHATGYRVRLHVHDPRGQDAAEVDDLGLVDVGDVDDRDPTSWGSRARTRHVDAVTDRVHVEPFRVNVGAHGNAVDGRVRLAIDHLDLLRRGLGDVDPVGDRVDRHVVRRLAQPQLCDLSQGSAGVEDRQRVFVVLDDVHAAEPRVVSDAEAAARDRDRVEVISQILAIEREQPILRPRIGGGD